MNRQVITYQRLKELEHLLSERDKTILHSLNKCRYLSSGHIQRLHFNDRANKRSSSRLANRKLAKLQEYGLIHSLERRIGGINHGSDSTIRLLTDAGKTLLHIRSANYISRKRLYEPSPNFLKHTLEVAEVYVQITEFCRNHGLTHTKTDLEPACWHDYSVEGSRPVYLKPDLFAVIENDKYEYSCFLEIDLNTEAPCVVLNKCQRYIHYYQAVAEGGDSKVFPLVIWRVPDETRKKSLEQHIAKCSELQPKNIFTVVTPDELEGLLRKGTGATIKKEAV